MGFIANRDNEKDLWDYILGDTYVKTQKFDGMYAPHLGKSIALLRDDFLTQLSQDNPTFKMALMDRDTKYWTKHGAYPGLTWSRGVRNEYGFSFAKLEPAVDVHRSVLPNEIVIESDYVCDDCSILKKHKMSPLHACDKCYCLNNKAVKIVGKILENKGFIPHYYYSGNKSIHVHIFLDTKFLSYVEEYSYPILMHSFTMAKFMKWIRTKMISCWDTNAAEFDRDLINPTHLIRAELSKNKRGFKTFLGYSYKDIGDEVTICNEKNRVYPRLAEIRESNPLNQKELCNEFVTYVTNKEQERITARKNNKTYIRFDSDDKIRSCVLKIMNDNFKDINDGFKRGMFILISELRRVYDDKTAIVIVKDWNNRMGNPVSERDIDYRFTIKAYKLTNKYINNFLKEIGYDK